MWVAGKKLSVVGRPLARPQHQRSGLGNTGEGASDADLVRLLGSAAAKGEKRLVVPRNGIKAHIGRHRRVGRQVVLGEIVGDRPRHIGVAGDPRHRRRRLLGHVDEQRDLLGARPARTCRHKVHRVSRNSLARHGWRSIAIAAAQRGAHRGQDILARRGHHAFLAAPAWRSRHRLWKVRPCGAGRSRPAVQPEAKGKRRNAPRRRPQAPSRRAASPVARR